MAAWWRHVHARNSPFPLGRSLAWRCAVQMARTLSCLSAAAATIASRRLHGQTDAVFRSNSDESTIEHSLLIAGDEYVPARPSRVGTDSSGAIGLPPRINALGWLIHRRLIPQDFFATAEWASFCISTSASTLMQVAILYVQTERQAIQVRHCASDTNPLAVSPTAKGFLSLQLPTFCHLHNDAAGWRSLQQSLRAHGRIQGWEEENEKGMT